MLTLELSQSISGAVVHPFGFLPLSCPHPPPTLSCSLCYLFAFSILSNLLFYLIIFFEHDCPTSSPILPRLRFRRRCSVLLIETCPFGRSRD
ncbi:hypothetical protein BJY00DRAFT_172845 [Aspergillus carlsbadensis]|nr:hypothetical protein BJY00DRAFT_172845 [Aspergillus carlsbadensis]